MTDASIITNASPLIALSQIGHLQLLQALHAPIVAPPAVAREVARSVDLPPWIEVRMLSAPVDPRVSRVGLGAGEREVISLGLELRARRLVLDEQRVRRLAMSLGLPVVGALGVLLAAKQHGLISERRPLVDALLDAGFFASHAIREWVLMQAGET